jgi:hypothetical protein
VSEFFGSRQTFLLSSVQLEACGLSLPPKHHNMKKGLVFLLCFSGIYSWSQQTQFKKNSEAFNIELLQGFTKQEDSQELYLGDIRVSYQYTIIPGTLRIGATGGGMYNNKVFSGYVGPNLALRLFTLPATHGSIGNVHLLLEHLWGMDKQKLLGGGFRAAIGNTLLLSLLAHDDYNLKYWNFEFGIGINLIHKMPAPPNVD